MDEDAIFHLSLPEISRWISSLASNSKKEISMALGWCKSMLEERPDDRPSSKQLLEIVAHDAGACSLRKEVFCSFCAAELSVQNTITSKSVRSDVGAVQGMQSSAVDWRRYLADIHNRRWNARNFEVAKYRLDHNELH
ncbi:hypothetical protein BK809_0001656 [Diplodia seriata]|uniref:Uncharacterized protein n=1 Tax=Diplodia seriata TaxID=420778 RepID=A0A1S8BB42_9PEZI|nr:hypothetical protein BK809_0001656 [Diplodia seriata]